MMEFIILGAVALLIVLVIAVERFFGKAGALGSSAPKGPDQGGTFGGVPNIAPGVFNPGSVPLPIYEVTEHIRAADEIPTPKEP